MKRRAFASLQSCAAAACVGWATVCAGYRLGPDPLALGMTARDASNALRARLVYVTRAAGTEVYVADRTVDIPGRGPVTERTFLQFKAGSLFGWTSGWR